MKKVIFIPGLSHEQREDLSAKVYAQRLMKAIDENEKNHNKKYKIEVSEQKYDEEGSLVNIIDIIEIEKEEKKIYNIYEFKYGKFLTKRYKESNIFFKFFSLLIVLISRFKSIIRTFFFLKKELNKTTKRQSLYFLFLYLFLSVYLFLLLPSILTMIANTIAQFQNLIWLLSILEDWEKWTSSIVLFFSTFMFFNPNTRSFFSTMATEYLSANQYLTIAEQQQLLMGKLARLVEYISEESEEDSDIEIHSYSFGSVLALDLLFPYQSEPPLRVQNRIKKLITIGCPFDFIEIYWSDYFSNRNSSGLVLNSWINVSSELDVLSSSFLNKKIKNEDFIPSNIFWENIELKEFSYDLINPKRVSYFQMIMFYGLKVHETYWDKNVDSKSCLNDIVKL